MSIQWIAELPDNSPYTGSTTRIAIDSGGVVHLVYVGATTVSLRHAKGKLDTFFTFETGLGTRIGLRYKWTITEIEPPWADRSFRSRCRLERPCASLFHW